MMSMYQRMEGQAWDKKGPALVAVRGPRDGELVRAEVTFALREPAGNAAALGMEEGELPGGTTAVFVHRGPRSGLSAGDEVLDAWIGEQGAKTESEIERARRVLEVAAKAEADGRGSVSLDGGMIDMPVILRAQNVLQDAGISE